MQISIPENTENINLLISGGADSTLLAFLLSKQTVKNINLHILNSGPISVHVVENIVSYLRNIFGNRYFLNYFKNRKFLIREATEIILSVYPGVVYTGCNKVVTHFTPTVYIPGDTPPVRGSAFNENHIRPFIDMDKVSIFQIYKDENILELLSLTRSCGVHGIGRCGGCYFCMERSWAAQINEINDINNIETTQELLL